MAVELIEKKFSMMHLVPLIIKSQVATVLDWTVIDGVKGVIPMGFGMAQSILTSGTETVTYGVLRINGAGQDTLTNTTFICSSGTLTRTATPYYIITAGGEIMEVISETDRTNAASTLTVKRACLGTSASVTGLATTNYLGVMNIIKHGTNLVGPHINVVLPLPDDRNTKLFTN
jgi:hypothetical protein